MIQKNWDQVVAHHSWTQERVRNLQTPAAAVVYFPKKRKIITLSFQKKYKLLALKANKPTMMPSPKNTMEMINHTKPQTMDGVSSQTIHAE